MERTGRTPGPRRRGLRQSGRLLRLALTGVLAILLGGCAAGGRPAEPMAQDASLRYVIPKDPHLRDLHGLRFVKLPLPLHASVDGDRRGAGIATSFRSDGILLVDRFTVALPDKGRRAGVEYRVQQAVRETGDGYTVTLRPIGVRTYGGTPFFGPPLPRFAEEDLLRHLASAVFTYTTEVASVHAPDLLSARLRRQAEPARMLPDEPDPVARARPPAWFSLRFEGVQVRVAFTVVPSGTGSRAILRLKVPSYVTAPHLVDLAQILGRLRERLSQIANGEMDPPRPAVVTSPQEHAGSISRVGS